VACAAPPDAEVVRAFRSRFQHDDRAKIVKVAPMLQEVSRLLAGIGSTGSFATCRTAAAEDHAPRAESTLSNLTILTNLIYFETGIGDSRGNYRSFPSQ